MYLTSDFLTILKTWWEISLSCSTALSVSVYIFCEAMFHLYILLTQQWSWKFHKEKLIIYLKIINAIFCLQLNSHKRKGVLDLICSTCRITLFLIYFHTVMPWKLSRKVIIYWKWISKFFGVRNGYERKLLSEKPKLWSANESTLKAKICEWVRVPVDIPLTWIVWFGCVWRLCI